MWQVGARREEKGSLVKVVSETFLNWAYGVLSFKPKVKVLSCMLRCDKVRNCVVESQADFLQLIDTDRSMCECRHAEGNYPKEHDYRTVKRPTTVTVGMIFLPLRFRYHVGSK